MGCPVCFDSGQVGARFCTCPKGADVRAAASTFKIYKTRYYLAERVEGDGPYAYYRILVNLGYSRTAMGIERQMYHTIYDEPGYEGQAMQARLPLFSHDLRSIVSVPGHRILEYPDKYRVPADPDPGP